MVAEFREIITVELAANGKDQRIWLKDRECPIITDGWNDAVKVGMIGRVYRGRFEFKAVGS